MIIPHHQPPGKRGCHNPRVHSVETEHTPTRRWPFTGAILGGPARRSTGVNGGFFRTSTSSPPVYWTIRAHHTSSGRSSAQPRHWPTTRTTLDRVLSLGRPESEGCNCRPGCLDHGESTGRAVLSVTSHACFRPVEEDTLQVNQDPDFHAGSTHALGV